jgi:hypothetical protein
VSAHSSAQVDERLNLAPLYLDDYEDIGFWNKYRAVARPQIIGRQILQIEQHGGEAYLTDDIRRLQAISLAEFDGMVDYAQAALEAGRPLELAVARSIGSLSLDELLHASREAWLHSGPMDTRRALVIEQTQAALAQIDAPLNVLEDVDELYAYLGSGRIPGRIDGFFRGNQLDPSLKQALRIRVGSQFKLAGVRQLVYARQPHEYQDAIDLLAAAERAFDSRWALVNPQSLHGVAPAAVRQAFDAESLKLHALAMLPQADVQATYHQFARLQRTQLAALAVSFSHVHNADTFNRHIEWFSVALEQFVAHRTRRLGRHVPYLAVASQESPAHQGGVKFGKMSHDWSLLTLSQDSIREAPHNTKHRLPEVWVPNSAAYGGVLEARKYARPVITSTVRSSIENLGAVDDTGPNELQWKKIAKATRTDIKRIVGYLQQYYQRGELARGQEKDVLQHPSYRRGSPGGVNSTTSTTSRPIRFLRILTPASRSAAAIWDSASSASWSSWC